MPYIKKKLRPTLDVAVVHAMNQDVIRSVETLVAELKGFVGSTELGGRMNYVFTQIFRKARLIDARIIVFFVCNTLFWLKPRYFKFEHVYATFNAMIDEWNRRKWTNYKNVVKELKIILSANKRYCATYEDRKIAENGDLE